MSFCYNIFHLQLLHYNLIQILCPSILHNPQQHIKLLHPRTCLIYQLCKEKLQNGMLIILSNNIFWKIEIQECKRLQSFALTRIWALKFSSSQPTILMGSMVILLKYAFHSKNNNLNILDKVGENPLILLMKHMFFPPSPSWTLGNPLILSF